MKKSGTNTASETEELLLHVYSGPVPSNFLLYEDDGETFGYQTGEFARRFISFDPGEKRIALSGQEGRYRPAWKKMKVVYHGFKNLEKISVNHKNIPVVYLQHSFFTPLEKYDPINDPESMGSELVQIADFPYEESEITITW